MDKINFSKLTTTDDSWRNVPCRHPLVRSTKGVPAQRACCSGHVVALFFWLFSANAMAEGQTDPSRPPHFKSASSSETTDPAASKDNKMVPSWHLGMIRIHAETVTSPGQKGDRLALINDLVARIGCTVDGFTVEQIEMDRVVGLTKDGPKTLYLFGQSGTRGLFKNQGASQGQCPSGESMTR